MKTFAYLTLVILLVILAPGAFAQHQTFTVNPDASTVTFTLDGTGHYVHGTFHVQSGAIDFFGSAQKIGGTVVVSAASGDSGDKSRDKKMDADVLDAPHYADVTFAPQSYQGTIAPQGDSTIQVSGTLTLHGTPHDITVPMQIHIEGPAATAKTHFTIPYVKWGLKDPSIFILKVAKEVEIDLTLSGKLTPAS